MRYITLRIKVMKFVVYFWWNSWCVSKPFDKVWHEGLFFLLKQNRISGNLLNIFEDFLRNRKQRVVLSGTHQVGKICRRSPKLNLGITAVLNLNHWFSRKSIFKSYAFCQWHFLIFLIWIPLQTKLTTTWKRLKHGLINGKWVSFSVLWSRHKKFYSHWK